MESAPARPASFRTAFAPARGALAWVRDVVFFGRPLLYLTIALGAIVYAAFYQLHERGYPFWDLSAYQNQAYLVSEAFSRSFGEGFSTITASLNEDYNLVQTAAIVPFILTFGESRFVYISAVLVVYFVPFVLIVTALARRMFPEYAAEAGTVAALVAVATPLAWRNIFQGYPDLGGAILMGTMLLLYDRSARGLRWRPLIWCGVAAACAILFRRHFVYGAFAFYVGFAADIAIAAWRRQRSTREIVLSYAFLAASGATMLAVLFIVAPGFVTRVASISYLQGFAAWQAPPSLIAAMMVGTVGLIPFAVALLGMLLVPQVTRTGRSLAQVILVASLTWALVWVVMVRQGPTHYPHVLPFLMIAGVTSLWLYAAHVVPRAWSRPLRAALAVGLALNVLLTIPISEPAFAASDAIPRFVLADRAQPLVNPSYDEIARLVYDLRARATPVDHIVVAATSITFNPDLLREAERTLFGLHEARLLIDNTPQVDSRDQSPPASALTGATYVIVADPFQFHLHEEDQKVVHVLVDAFGQHWKVTRDFTELPERYHLANGAEVAVYKRTRPDSLAVAADTSSRMAAYMRGADTSRSIAIADSWVQVSSPYPMTVSTAPNGTTSIFAHPTAEGQAPNTELALIDDRDDDVRISGNVGFFDPRCVGDRVQLGTEYRGPQVTTAGEFKPGGTTHFDVMVHHVRGNPVFLRLVHAASSPTNIYYCTTRIDDLRVARAGSPLAAGAVRRLVSQADPFAVAATAAKGNRAAPAAPQPLAAVTWSKLPGTYAGDIARQADGSWVVSTHPTRRGDPGPTILQAQGIDADAVRVTGTLRFYSDKCIGEEVVASAAGDAAPVSAGVFKPNRNGDPLDVTVRRTRDRPLQLLLESTAAAPNTIEFCATRIENLRVSPA